ncbi:MAG: hypothetical protein LBU42_04040, partial [Prevotellaceae bacterium]|nr:hypothetical protein [Prevotellaceae bacterium]
WCAYGSDFPPNAVDNSSGGYDLKGTPPFIITTSAGTAEVNAYTYSGGTITALTDATGCPGVLCGKDGEAAGLLNCCVTGTTNCSGVCKAISTYTTNDGACTGICATAYVQSRNECDAVVNSRYSTYYNSGCTAGCMASRDPTCQPETVIWSGLNAPSGALTEVLDKCCGDCAARQYARCWVTRPETAGLNYLHTCHCCN